MVVKGLFYTKDHEWSKLEAAVVTIGITDYAQQMLGEITFVELPEVGSDLAAHDEAAVVESTKAAGEVYAPAAGKVTEVNSELESSPELINQQCYEGGWIFKMTLANPADINKLMDSAAYEAYLQEI